MAATRSISADLPTAPPARPDGHGTATPARRILLPYLLVAPAVVALGLALGYPVVRQVVLSLQEFGLAQQFGAPAEWVGLDNYRALVSDAYLWKVVLRSLIFCVVVASVTMTIGMSVALVMTKMSRPVRLLAQTGLLLAWAMPALATLTVWQWLFDTQYGIVNWLLTRLGASYEGHSWLLEPLSFFFVAAVIVVWMSVPFVAFTGYAALLQVPDDLVEAAELDGAGVMAAAAARRVPQHPLGPDGRRPARDHLGAPGVHPDLRAPGGRRDHPRDQPARHPHLPARHRRRRLRHRRGGRDLHAAADGRCSPRRTSGPCSRNDEFEGSAA